MFTPTTINEEYDIIIAGGGAAGCVVAGRLAAADPELRILILEAGPTTHNNPIHTRPALFLSHLAPGSRTARVHTSPPTAALGDRSALVPCGQCLGGGGSINFMMYTRASASDYDDWKTAYENPGWGSDELIPLLRRTETWQVDAAAGPTHGTDGPLKVSLGGLRGKLLECGEQFLQVARTLDPTRAQAPSDADTNDLSTINVYTHRWINGETGARSDVPHHVIYPLKETRPNLHFVTGIHVKHVVFDDKGRPTGVAFALNPLFYPGGPTESRTVRGTKLVVLSAGSFGTPGILERSGIGAKHVLERVGVEQRVDLPSVGENYQDHNILFVPYFSADEAQTFDAIFRNDEGAIEAATAEFAKTGKGLIGHGVIEAGIKWRPELSELAELGPEFKEVWDSYFANAPDKPVLWFGVASALVGCDSSLVPPRKYFTLAPYSEYPVARGHVHITHGEDVSAPLDFVPGYLESMADVKLLTWGYKFTREIARRMPIFRGEPPALHPAFAPGGPAQVVAHAEGPVAFNAPRIEYSEEDERALEAYARATSGVVDSRLNVRRPVHWPGNVGANTYSTALVIGEKAAVIIAEELGININKGSGVV
ncbi:alcohol oxidase [Russula compacta]|nr:alcohol oxidase [Russula compacta]